MKEISGSDQAFIGRLTVIIHANLGDENFGVNELAQKSGISLKNCESDSIRPQRK